MTSHLWVGEIIRSNSTELAFFNLYWFAGGRHALAMTVDGKVFSWGEGDDGKLGHYSRTYVTDCIFSCNNVRHGYNVNNYSSLIKV